MSLWGFSYLTRVYLMYRVRTQKRFDSWECSLVSIKLNSIESKIIILNTQRSTVFELPFFFRFTCVTLLLSISPSVTKTITSDALNAFFVDSFWNIAFGCVPPSGFADSILVHNLADEFQRTICSNEVAWQILNSASKTFFPIETVI